jgi:transposase
MWIAEGVVPETTGRPAYHPAAMLKIYVYGYVNQVQFGARNGAQC